MADWTLAELAAELEAATVQDDPNSWDQPPVPSTNESCKRVRLVAVELRRRGG